MSINKLKIGFIGTGNMGCALIKGILNNGFVNSDSIYVYDIDKVKSLTIAKELNLSLSESSRQIVENCSVIIPAVKPQYIHTVLDEIKTYLTIEHLVISIAAGINISALKKAINDKCDIIRTMPNTPALIGEGMTSICKDNTVTESNMKLAAAILSTCGIVEYVDEKSIHAATAIGGSSPAYIYQFIESIADGGVLMGLPREQSYKIATQAVIGAAKMILETKRHPGELKDMVCSPGGTTIEAVASLERNHFRSAIIEAVRECAHKSIEMEREEF